MKESEFPITVESPSGKPFKYEYWEFMQIVERKATELAAQMPDKQEHYVEQLAKARRLIEELDAEVKHLKEGSHETR